jgi:predicted esterase
MIQNYFKIFSIIFLCFLISCSTPEEVLETNLSTNTSTFIAVNSQKNIPIYYHIPENTNTPIVIVFHGGGRNAKDYRNAMIAKADEYQFIVIVPEFSIENFPGGDGYNLGNVYDDGDNPSPNSLNPETEWAFSLVEPIFSFMKKELINTSEKHHIIGHSAGAQFAHRLVMFTPNASSDKIVVSAAGWYTVPDFTIDFPYGFQESILENSTLNTLFSKEVYIQVGELDNNPNDGGLRRNNFADAQGVNRFQRAYHFYNEAKELAAENKIPFIGKYKPILV